MNVVTVVYPPEVEILEYKIKITELQLKVLKYEKILSDLRDLAKGR